MEIMISASQAHPGILTNNQFTRIVYRADLL